MNCRSICRRAGLLAACMSVFVCAVLVASPSTFDQPAEDTVGLIEGDDISVSGPMNVEVMAGQTKTILRSGSDVRVKSGQARVNLVEGGQFTVCGPAHFSVLKSAGALTVALESGVLHALLEGEPALTVYTAQIQAQMVAIGDDPRELLLGFENPGAMCIHTIRGAMRLEQQLSGQSIIVPQGGDILLLNGQIDSIADGGGHCQCDLLIAKSAAPSAPPAVGPTAEASSESSSKEDGVATGPARTWSYAAPAPEKPTPKEDVIYEVTMPPLVFDAKARVQPAPDPSLMMIVKRVRVRPELVFRGRVESEPVATAGAAAAPPQSVPSAAAPPPTPAQPEGSVTDRVRSFLRRLWTKSS